VFKEPGAKFDPRTFTSHFTSVYIIVEPVKLENDNEIHYRLTVANKRGVIPFGPYLPEPSIFPKDSETRKFILTKLINADRAAMYSPVFSQKLAHTRIMILQSLVDNYAGGSEIKVKKNRRISLSKRSQSKSPSITKLSRQNRSFSTSSGVNIPKDPKLELMDPTPKSDSPKRKKPSFEKSLSSKGLTEDKYKFRASPKKDIKRHSSKSIVGLASSLDLGLSPKSEFELSIFHKEIFRPKTPPKKTYSEASVKFKRPREIRKDRISFEISDPIDLSKTLPSNISLSESAIPLLNPCVSTVPGIKLSLV